MPVLRRVRLRPQLPHHVPVHAHLSAGNQQLSMPPRSNPRPRNNLLQSFFHGFFLKVFSGRARHFVPFFRLDLRLLFPTSLPLYLVFSLSRRRGLLRFAALPLRHSFIVRRRLFQQFLPRFHRRQIRGCSVCFTAPRRSSRDARLVSQRILRRRKSLVAPQRFPRQRLKLLQTRQLLQIAQPEPHQKFLRRLVQNRPAHHFFAPRRGNQVLVQQRADHSRSVHPANLGNFRRSHRLLVSNHRQSLQRRHRKPQRRPQTLDKP